MKKVLLLSGVLALGAVASYGAPIASCGSLGNLLAIETAGSCEVGDKVFSAFSYSAGSGDPGAADVTVQGTSSVAGQAFGLQFGSDLSTAWVSNFTLSFNISIDQTACQGFYGAFANCYISGTQDQMQGGSAGPSNTAAVTVTHTAGGVINVNALSTSNETGQILGLNQSTMADSFAGVGSLAFPVTQFGTEVFQGTVPEPMTFSLMGAGLLGLGLLRKRISRS